MPLQHQEHETGHGQTPTASSRDHKLLRLNREPFWLAVRHPPGGGFGATVGAEELGVRWLNRAELSIRGPARRPHMLKAENTAWSEHGDY